MSNMIKKTVPVDPEKWRLLSVRAAENQVNIYDELDKALEAYLYHPILLKMSEDRGNHECNTNR